MKTFVNFQPLMECYVNLREKGTAINIHLTETWWRHYQVSLLFRITVSVTRNRLLVLPLLPRRGACLLHFPPNIFSGSPYLHLHLHLHVLGR